MKVIFFGTPGFAVPSLEALIASRRQVVAVVTQPDRPRGRSRAPLPSPVKERALKAGIQVLQPEDLKEKDLLGRIRSLAADLAAVVAYGRLLPMELLRLFPHGAVNLHAYLLPRYRGAAPIQWALIRGESQTGVTIFQMDEKLDHGPVLIQEAVPIAEEDTAVSLGRTLATVGSRLLLDALELIESGSAGPRPQEESLATEAPRLKKEDGLIDWKESCRAIHHRVRGLQPWPGATAFLEGQPIKLLATAFDTGRGDPSKESRPGAVVAADPRQGLWVQAGQGRIRIDRLQLAGGKALEASDFLRGHPLAVGAVLTASSKAV
ncbi:MAG: methionyl-tRNA formyltransferase [Candidatus Omnitrophica bacterium]|nr:methionyl-tRNA formyltransferase [Candidatus Omnitrophota bacterium]